MTAPALNLPFNSETARIAAQKSAEARKAKRELETVQAGKFPVAHGNSKPNPGSVALIRRAWRRFWQLAISTDDPAIAGMWVAHASEAFEQEARLCGRDYRKPKQSREPATPAPKPIAPVPRVQPVESFPPLDIPQD